MLRWHPAVGRRCLRRSAMMQADSETVAEDAAGKIGKPQHPCMHWARLVINGIRLNEDMIPQLSQSRRPLRMRTTDPG